MSKRKKDRHPSQKITVPPGSSIPSVILWCRTVGAGSILFGGIGLTAYFWWAVAFVYSGIALLLVDLRFERFGRQDWLRHAISLVLVAVFAVFSIGVVFRAAPVTIESYVMNVPHGEGSEFGGIVWNDKLSDLRIWLTNPTSMNYDNLDLVDRKSVV